MLIRTLVLFVGVIVAAVLLRYGINAIGGVEALRPLYVPIVNLYLDIFNSPMTATALSFAMIALAVMLYIYYARGRIRPAQADLTSLRWALQHIGTQPGSAETVQEIDRTMAKFPRFQQSWKLFRSSLVVDDAGNTTSTAPPSRYFNIKMLEHQGMRIRFFLGLPGDFVGMGLVFTFLGLVAGLYFASQSMMTSNLDEARQGLTRLLHAATFKFLTSIVGISCSLVLSAAQRILLERVQAGIDEVQIRLEELLPTHVQRELGAPVAPSQVKPVAAQKPTLSKVG